MSKRVDKQIIVKYDYNIQHRGDIMGIIAAFIAFVMSLLAGLVYFIALFGLIFIVMAFVMSIWQIGVAGFCMIMGAFIYFAIMNALGGN